MSFSEVFGPIKWHMLALAVVFYLVPAAQFIVPQEYGNIVFIVSSILNILVTAISSIVLTIHSAFRWYYPFILVIMFGLSLFMYYDATATVYLFAYFGMSYASSGMGRIFREIMERNR